MGRFSRGRRLLIPTLGAVLILGTVGPAHVARADEHVQIDASILDGHAEIIRATVTSESDVASVTAFFTGWVDRRFELHWHDFADGSGGEWRTDPVHGLPRGAYNVHVGATTVDGFNEITALPVFLDRTPHVRAVTLPSAKLDPYHPVVKATGRIVLWDPVNLRYMDDAFGAVVLELSRTASDLPEVRQPAKLLPDGTFRVQAAPTWAAGGATLTARLRWVVHDPDLYTVLPEPVFDHDGLAQAQVAVPKAPVATRLTVSKPSVNRSGRVKLTGVLRAPKASSSAVAGRTLKLQQSRNGRTGWSTVTSARTRSGGRYTVLTTRAHPRWYVRVTFAGNDTLRPATSAVRRLPRKAR